VPPPASTPALQVAVAAQSALPEHVVLHVPLAPQAKLPVQLVAQQTVPPWPSSTHAPLEHWLPAVHAVPFVFKPVLPPVPVAPLVLVVLVAVLDVLVVLDAVVPVVDPPEPPVPALVAPNSNPPRIAVHALAPVVARRSKSPERNVTFIIRTLRGGDRSRTRASGAARP